MGDAGAPVGPGALTQLPAGGGWGWDVSVQAGGAGRVGLRWENGMCRRAGAGGRGALTSGGLPPSFPGPRGPGASDAPILWAAALTLRTPASQLWRKRGHTTNLTSSGAACTANLTNAETYRNPVGWSEIRIGLRSLHGAKLARASFFFLI